MKKIILGLITVSLLAFSYGALADKIIISGSPVALEKVYMAPTGTVVTTTSQPYYFNVDDVQKICYITKEPSLTSLTATMIRVDIGGTTQSLYCYDYSPDFFVVKP